MKQEQHFDHFGTTLALSAVVTGPVATTEIVAAPGAGKKIRVLGWVLTSAGAATVAWKSATTAKTGVMTGAAGSPMSAPFNPVGWFDCAENEALNLTAGTAAVAGVVSYAVVKIGA